MENDTIYFVTVFYVDKAKLNSPCNKPGEKLYKRLRCWGWYKDKKIAEQAIKKNWTDMYEVGYYNLAMIEPMSEGICSRPRFEEKWFSVDYLGNNSDYAITEIEKPKRFKNIVGFSYA